MNSIHRLSCGLKVFASRHRLLFALLCLLSACLFSPQSAKADGHVCVGFNCCHSVVWEPQYSRFKFTHRYYDYTSKNRWIKAVSVKCTAAGKTFDVINFSGHYMEGWGPEAGVYLKNTSNVGKTTFINYSNEEQQLTNWNTNNIDVDSEGEWWNDCFNTSYGFTNYWLKSVWVTTYWYPPTECIGTTCTFTITGYREGSSWSGWRESSTASVWTEPKTFSSSISSSAWNTTSGNYELQGSLSVSNKNDNSSAYIFVETSTDNKNWNTRYSFNKLLEGKTTETFKFNSSNLMRYVSGDDKATSGTKYTRQQWADGVYMRLMTRTFQSPLCQPYGFVTNYSNSTIHTGRTAVMDGKGLAISQSGRDITISWNVIAPKDNTSGQNANGFQLEKYNSATDAWEVVSSNISYAVGKTAYSYKYTLKSSEINNGNVPYSFRVWKKNFNDQSLWAEYLTASGSATICTDYKKVDIKSVTLKPGTLNAIIAKEFSSSNGIWDDHAHITAKATGYQDVTVSNQKYDNDAIPMTLPKGCENYSFTLEVTIDDITSYKQVSQAKDINVADVGVYTINNFDASKGYYSDYVLISWNIPAGEGNFDYFDITRKAAGSSDEIFVSQLTHTGKTSYSYQDREMDAGVVYEYSIIGYHSCNNKPAQAAEKKSYGFSQPYASVSGRIAYNGNQGVKGAQVIIEGGDDVVSNYSLNFNGQSGCYATLPSAPFDFTASPERTFQAYVHPTESGNRTIFEKKGIASVALNASNQLVVAVGGKSTTLTKTILPNGEWSQLSLVYSLSGSSCGVSAYVNGTLTESVSISEVSLAAANKDNDIYLGVNASLKNPFAGYMDEIRFWAIALDEATIQYNCCSYLSGHESGLLAYYRCDANGVTQIFDISGRAGVFNKNHGNLTSLVEHKSDNVPSTDQLANKTLTDEDGAYLINTVPYSSQGVQYNVVPMFGEHSFYPNKKPIFASSSSVVFNNIDFEDKSSFNVSGFVYYENTACPVEGVNFYVDGVICSVDGEAVSSKADGSYTISVPIGDHNIVAKKQGHTFVADGRFPSNPLKPHTFDEPLSNLTFWDNTLVVVAGRVCGGEAQAKAPLGLGQTVNNVGQAVVTLKATPERVNVVQNGTVFDDATEDRPVAQGSEYVNSSAYYASGDNNLTRLIVVKTDPKTGEWAVKVPPIAYTIESLVVPNNKTVSEYFNGYSFSDIDVTNVNSVKTDTAIVDGKKLEFEYNGSSVYAYVATPSFSVEDLGNTCGAYGDATIQYTDLVSTQNVPVYTVTDNKVDSYIFGLPVFTQLNDYTFKLKAFETYYNYDEDAKNPVVDIVPLAGASVELTNEMSSEQSVYVESGVADEGTEKERSVKAGEFVSLTENIFELDDNGEATYQWKAGFPNISDGHELHLSMAYTINGRKYTWSANGKDDGLTGIVLGDLPTGNNFVTSGPDKVLMILRDPAGTGSSAYWQQEATWSREEHSAGGFINQNEVGVTGKLGHKYTTLTGTPGFGVITEVELTAEFNEGINVNVSTTSSESWKTTISSTNKVSTSEDFDFVGSIGDVFIGCATNVIFGKARNVGVRKDENGEFVINLDEHLSASQEYSTGFNYSQNYIENTVLPNILLNRNALLQTYSQAEIDQIVANGNKTDKVIYLTTLQPSDPNFGKPNYDKDAFGALANTDKSRLSGPSYTMLLPDVQTPGETYQDMVLWYNQQYDTWIKTLAANEKAKVDAIENSSTWFKKNVSFDGGAKIEDSFRSCSEHVTAEDTEVEILYVAGGTAGMEADGCGVSASFKTSIGGKTSNGTVTTTENCTEFGYSLVESGDDDALSVDIYNAPDGFGPIFVTRAGQTSCPYEGEAVTKYYNPNTVISYATMKIEDPKISCENPYVTDVPAGGQAIFKLNLRNDSEIGEDIWFKLGQELDTNPNGAILQINGMSLTSDNLDFRVPAGGTVPVTLTLKQSDPSVLNYENIGISLFSSCQWDDTGNYEPISSTVYVSAQFVPTCSEISLSANSTTVNSYTGPDFSGQVRDFDPSYSSLKALRVLYRQEGDANWTLANEYVLDEANLTANNQLIPDGGRFSYKLDMSNSGLYPDGVYEIKALSACTFGTEEVTREGDVVKFVKDMARPQLLGLAQPSDGILDAGDEISVTFNEDIRNGSLTRTNNFIVSGILNDAEVAHDVALKLDGNSARTQSDVVLSGKDFTIESWVNVASEGQLLQHADAKSGLRVAVTAEGKLAISLAGQDYLSAETMPFNKWVYLAVSYSAARSTLSAVAAYDAVTLELFNGVAAPAYKANGALSVGNGVSGAISEVSLWDASRSFAKSISEMHVGKAPSTRNLIGYWKFDEGHGTLATDAARNRNMVLSAPSWYLNNTNFAAHLDGNGYIDLNIASSAVESTADYLVELWFRGAAQANTYLWSAGSLGVKFNADGKLSLVTDVEELTISDDNYLDNAWHSFALNVLRNGMTTVYVDGEALQSFVSESVPAPASAYLTIGALRQVKNNKGDYSANFTGDVDDVRLWVASFNSTAIEQNRFNRLAGSEAGLVAYYPFESSSLDLNLQKVTDFDVADKSASAAGKATLVDARKADSAPALKAKREETSISYSFVASERQIVLSLSEAAARLEGSTITFTVRNVRDANENISEPIVWSAYVNRNRLVWTDDEVQIEQKNLTASQFAVSISNGGSTTENWQISGLPTWMKASRTSGALAALSEQKITFSIDAATAIGTYEETIYLSGNDKINEPLTVRVKVAGEKPDWSVNPKDYVMNMNLVGQLFIKSELSLDPEDLVAAFIDGKCVGVGSPEYYERYDACLLNLDVYGNTSDAGAVVSFKVWDASTGITYPAVTTSQTVTLVANSIVGSVDAPVVLTAQDVQEQILALGKGWNWVSLNVNPLDTKVSSVFAGVRSVASQVKDKLTFAVPNGSRWYGSLSDVNVGKMYRVHAQSDVELSVVGKIVDPAEAPVTVAPLWNWIGYTQTASASVGEALSGVNPVEGDIIKGQSGFAFFHDYEWVGSLKTLAPGVGYMYYSNASDSKQFTYPAVLSTSAATNRDAALTHYQAISAAAFSGNMTVIAHVSCDGRDVPFAEVAVFADGKCRTTQIADALGRVFLTIPGDQATELSLAVISSDGSETTGIPAFAFAEDAMVGTLSDPFEICVASAADALTHEVVASLAIFPNPVVENVHIVAPADASVQIFNILGQLMTTTSGDSHVNVANWSAGYYVVKVITSDGNSLMGNFLKK